MKMTAKKAREITDKSLPLSAALILGKIASAAAGNGKMPRGYILTPCNSHAARGLRDVGFRVIRILGFALVRW